MWGPRASASVLWEALPAHAGIRLVHAFARRSPVIFSRCGEKLVYRESAA
jgi:hypothetical protein